MSAGSGILPSHETLALVDELRKNNSKYLFALFRVEGQAVVPDSHWPATDADAAIVAGLKANGGDGGVAAGFEKHIWPQFVKAMGSANGPRFGVIDFSYTSKDGRTVRTLTSVTYCSDKVAAKLKMTFASTKTAFEAKINIGKKYQGSDISDLEYSAVFEAVSAGK